MGSLVGRMLTRLRADERRSLIHSPGLQTTHVLRLTSRDFVDGGTMPVETTAYGANRSPALSWSDVPEGTKQLVLIIEDIDVPMRRPIIHTVAVLDPGVVAVVRGELGDVADRFLKGGFGRPGYNGPRPIPGHGAHRYRFHLYALDTAVPESTRSARDLRAAMAGHVLARGTVTGTFRRD